MGHSCFGTSRVPAGASIVVLGAGAVGLASVMAARVAGADPIIGVDIDDERLELARSLGATHVVNGRQEDTRASVLQITHVARTTSSISPDRLDAVLIAVHLLFNEGYWSTDDEAPIRGDLCRLAIGLGRSLYEAHPTAAEVGGLLALLLFHEARRPARLNAEAVPIPLPDQDRTRWDRPTIGEATAILERALATGQAGPLQTEAAISAVHCRATSAAETDWREIAALYALLERMRPTPAVRVNRAFAVARAQGPAAGLALLDAPGVPDAAAYPYAHLVRGALLEELGRDEEAIGALQLARAQARNAHEEAQIDARVDRLRRR
jgi:RNA polymerase sigma-70 factor, ECF subfamily